MEDDLLSRRAVDENLSRLARERMHGQKLVGVTFDERSKSWYEVLSDGRLALIRTCDEESQGPRRVRARGTRASTEKK
jgi:hypothetical protein